MKKPKPLVWNRRRIKAGFVDTLHFNHNGKKLCHIIVFDPHHTTDIELVTCRNCKTKIRERKL